MSQFLPRGCPISGEYRIKKAVASGCAWQIYLTNLNTYVLAVKTALYEKWAACFQLPEGIFLDETLHGCRVFLSANDYLVSSMESGPYPEDDGQIEAFSIAFKAANDRFPDTDFHDAIYIEEYSLLLPVSSGRSPAESGSVYAKWLTGGVNISIASFERVHGILSWLSKAALKKSAQLAGFEIAAPEATEPEAEAPEEMEASDIGLAESPTEGADPAENNGAMSATDSFTLVGRPDLERFFHENIIDIVLRQAQYERMGIPFPGATILYGPPGCGKTYAVEKLSAYLGWKRFDIDSSTIASSYLHETSRKISAVFQRAIEAAPSILVIDEMEAFLADRSMAGPSGMHHTEEVAEFLRRIPEASSNGVLVFAMTNMIDQIDPAILRRGRFDHIVEVKMPTAEEIAALLRTRFLQLPVDETVDADRIAKSLELHPMSDVTFVIREAGRLAVKQNLNRISGKCFDEAVSLLPKKKERNKIGFANVEREDAK